MKATLLVISCLALLLTGCATWKNSCYPTQCPNNQCRMQTYDASYCKSNYCAEPRPRNYCKMYACKQCPTTFCNIGEAEFDRY